MGRGPIFAAWALAAATVMLAPQVDAAPRYGTRPKGAQPAKRTTKPAKPPRGGAAKPSGPTKRRVPRAGASETAASTRPATSTGTPSPSAVAPSGPPTPWSDGRIWTTTFPEDSDVSATNGATATTTVSSSDAPTPAVSRADASPREGAALAVHDDAHDRPSEPRSLPRRRLSIGVNPLPLIAGRYGINVELVPFRHHALVASAWLQTFTPSVLRVLMPSEIDVSNGASARPGGELGYRFYTGREGAHGLFAGVSGMAMPIAYPRVSSDATTEVVSLHAYGGAFDVGAQAITDSGFTIGGGLGVMYLAYTPPRSVDPPPGVSVPSVPEPHVLPRLLLSAGWSF